MKNTKYKEGCLRVIVGESGVQYLATPEGDKLPLITYTAVSQDMEQSRLGTVFVQCELHINDGTGNSSDSAIRVLSNTSIQVGTKVLSVDDVQTKTMENSGMTGAVIRTTAYLDPTM